MWPGCIGMVVIIPRSRTNMWQFGYFVGGNFLLLLGNLGN